MQLTSTSVVLAVCTDYDAALALTLASVLEEFPLPELHSARVLLKPNLISAGTPLACTEGALLIEVARWFVMQGARVCVGDSPAFGTAAAALRRLGIDISLKALGVEICNFDRIDRVRLSSGQTAALASDALDCDLLVNLPRIKAHAQTRITAAVKNCFGCLVGPRKAWWHMVYGGQGGNFSSLLLEILEHLPASITVADGIQAMHVTGPVRGDHCSPGFLAAGENPVAVDSALLQVLGIEPRDCPLALEAIQQGVPGSDATDLVFPRLLPGEIRYDDFEIPQYLNPVRFSPFRFLRSFLKKAVLAARPEP